MDLVKLLNHLDYECDAATNYPLVEEVEKVWFKLVDLEAMMYADFIGEQPEKESGEDMDFDDEEKFTLDIISEAFHKCIGELQRPNFNS